MPVVVQNLQRKVPISPPRIVRITRAILEYTRIKKASLTIIFVSPANIKALNRKYLQRDDITDVLAFDLGEGSLPSLRAQSTQKKTRLNGDIVICADAAVCNAHLFKASLAHEIVLYIVHGILHLLGFNDHGTVKTRIMRKKEQEIMGYLGSRVATVITDK